MKFKCRENRKRPRHTSKPAKNEGDKTIPDAPYCEYAGGLKHKTTQRDDATPLSYIVPAYVTSLITIQTER